MDALAKPTPKQRRLRLDPLVRLCRLEYQGGDAWGFAFYKYSNNKYERSILPTGSWTGTPEECFDCAGFAYLANAI